ncbi:MAG: ribonuclease P protein component [Planctomycetota bacterium]
MPDSQRTPSLHFRARHRLSHDRDYSAVFDRRLRATRGPITLHLRENDLGHHRLGLTIGRKAGNAVTRNALKRRLREAFRQLQHELPVSYDIVVTTRPHTIAKTGDYLRWMGSGVKHAHEKVMR